jgi:hypothetical protein
MDAAKEWGRGNGGARVALWLSWLLAALSLVLAVASVVLYILTRSAQTPTTWGTGGEGAVFIFLVPFIPFPLVGALIVFSGQKSTLAIAGFYRRTYDARKRLEFFAARLRDATNLDTLGDDLVSVVRETIQPEHVSFWVREPSAGAKPKADG